tara:strand:+ start:184 stop:477 length:294 start_codon:yes stop_codon:yes gene_type:complete
MKNPNCSNNWIEYIINSLTDNRIFDEYLIIRKNIPKNLLISEKNKIYDLIDNYCLNYTNINNIYELEIYLNKIPYSSITKLYDLKFYIANCKLPRLY